MRPLPDVSVQIQDGALGILPPPTDGVSAKIGIATAGPVGEIVTVTDLKQVRETFGGGPLAEALAVHLSLSGAPVHAVRVAASSAGTVSSVTREGSQTGLLDVLGSPRDAYRVIVEITRENPEGTPTDIRAFRYSLDGGETWSPEIAFPDNGIYELPNTGLSIWFVHRWSLYVYKVGDRFTFYTTAPGYTIADTIEALDVLLGDPREWGWVHVVGPVTPAAAAAVAQRMAEAEANYRYAFALLEAPDEPPSALLSSWGPFASPRVAVSAGYVDVVSPLTGQISKRPVAWVASGRLAAIPVHEHLGRVNRGPVPGVVRLYHDEFRSPGLDGAGFITMRSIIGRTGAYFTRGRIKAPQGSDFQFIENRRVMDRACRIARNAALRYLNETVRVDDEGNIYEPDARAIEAYVEGQLIAGLVSPGHASDVQVRLKRDTNVLSSRSTVLTVRVRPLGYLEYIEADIGFTNPALAPAGA